MWAYIFFIFDERYLESSQSPDSIFFSEIPTFGSITPAHGPIAGGTLLTIKANYSNMHTPMAVFFNGSVLETVNDLTRYEN
jgi:hypothetical protein